MPLHILSGGAVRGLVTSLAERFTKQTGFGLAGEFGAVGVMADELRKGRRTDLVILTGSLLARLAEERLVIASSTKNIGLVETALAVRAGDPSITVRDANDLRRVLVAADAIFVPDTSASTAGIHIAKVIKQLGITDEVASRLKIHPNGAAAMRHLAYSDAKTAIGCTQATEIINTKGIVLASPLPRGCELATLYAVGMAAKAASPLQAQVLIDLLTSPEHRELRARAGFISYERGETTWAES